ncbi:hypothetical protein [Chitinimonas sp. BJYL2]|nr:hypothetical protein [Chitinimonas sp. BJYL2]
MDSCNEWVSTLGNAANKMGIKHKNTIPVMAGMVFVGDVGSGGAVGQPG